MASTPAGSAMAHELRPGYLELRETETETYAVTWKVPAKGDLRLSLHARLPDTCRTVVPVSTRQVGRAWMDLYTVNCVEGLAGGTIAIDGLESPLTDVLVRMDRLDGTSQIQRLTPDENSFVVLLDGVPVPGTRVTAGSLITFSADQAMVSGVLELQLLKELQSTAGERLRLPLRIRIVVQ